ncbi:hypothetical protein HRI_005281800 [Hibiscus trionum]|uniref:Retrotransposon gag domain-containing protein n=1 Tax=Hibiscus trionum TaxID=183268 RepID=A0A9W7JK24_HIBTR|nr:hypothetical protein HRI_005281800 [Hibiscus trionum]
MTRKNPSILAPYNPEIEASARRTHGETLRRKKQSTRRSEQESTSETTPIDEPTQEPEPMADQTIRELNATPTVQQPLCIAFPQGDTPFQLKTGLIHLLPTFNGLPTESPHKHLAEFHMVCSSMKPQGVSEDQIKLRAFPFSLAGNAKEWLFYLPPNSINTWGDLSRVFLDRYFPAAKATELRRNILSIQKMHDESLYEYWERFKKLCASCPQHGLSEQTLLQYLYEGMLPMDKKMVDAASGGALVNMTSTAARTLISTMAANSQQFGSTSEPSRRVQTVSTISLENKIDNLTNIVYSLVSGEIKAAKVCEICTMPDHATDLCPLLRDTSGAQVNAIHNFPGPPQRPYNPHSNTFNPGWRDHPNLSYGNQNPNYQPRQQPPHQNQAPQKSSLESIVERLAVSQEKFQTQTQSHLQQIDKQISQLTQAVSRIESQGKLPSQTETNPRENVSAITLRSGTVITPKPPKQTEQKSDEQGSSSKDQNEKSPPTAGNSKSNISVSTYEHVPPFPGRLAKRDKKEEEKEILDVFKKVEINIPLLDVIRKVPKYARFLKDLCTN